MADHTTNGRTMLHQIQVGQSMGRLLNGALSTTLEKRQWVSTHDAISSNNDD